MISGINGYNSYSSQALLNQHRLSQILQNRYSGFSPVSAVSKLSSQKTSSDISDSISYVKSYSSTMTDLMSSANALRDGNAGSVVNKKSAISSDTAVLEASNRFRISSDQSYEVDVSQLAAAQTNVSEAFSSAAKATSDINMQIAIGDKTVSVNVAANVAGTQRTNSQTLSEAAKQINASNSGLKASVVTKDGKSSLQIQSKDTGTSSSFMVSGSFSEANQGGMANVTQEAQNASYSVTTNGETKSAVSESNKINLGYGIEATLKKEGSSTVSVGADPDKIVSAMEDFVKSYNNAVTLLSKNTDRGNGTTSQLSRLQSSVVGSEESMGRLGLSFNKDGTLSLSKTTLTENLRNDPKLTKDLVGSSYGLGQRAFNSAQSSLNTSVSSLIKNDLAQMNYEQANDPMNYMSTYSRTGAYNMMNYYAVGSMFNTFV